MANFTAVEQLMHYIWQHRLWDPAGLTTVDGRRIKVIDPGLHNTDQGPDFFNAKIEIDGKLWAGNVEIHVRATDWYRHHHDRDMAYDSVVLHVVGRDDCAVTRANGDVIPQCVMPVSPLFAERFEQLTSRQQELPCGPQLAGIPSLTVTEWMEALAFERLHGKVERINQFLEAFGGSWEDATYVLLSRNLGFGINGEAFERLARRTPLRILRRHSDSSTQLEAILFGQAGLLNPIYYPDDAYYQQLCREYAFLAHKYDLHPMESANWRFFRIRPQNFPHRRIALLARCVEGGFSLLRDIVEAPDADAVRRLFDRQLTGYWQQHFTFGSATGGMLKALSAASVDILLINTAAPLIYAYGEATDNYAVTERAIALLEAMRPERNSIVRLFEFYGIKADSALRSQALIQLRRNYCEARKCIFCRFGHRLLAAAAKP